MAFTVRKGFGKYGLPTGKRDLRDHKTNLESNMFKDPLSLALDILNVIFIFIYVPLENFIMYFTAKPKSLRGKVCFVTGSGRGLGRGICIALAKEGAILACADVNEEGNSKTVEILQEMGAKAKAYKLNVANKSEVDALARRVESELGAVYLLVNNAAIVMPCPQLDEGYVKAVFGVNIIGAIWTIGAFLPKMKELKEGHIVNISSFAAVLGGPFLSMYCATKASLSSYSHSVRVELAHEGYHDIFVTTVHPWVMNTSADYVETLSSRLKTPEIEDVANLIMNSIKYNREEVTTDTFFFYLSWLMRFVPVKMYMAAARIFKIEATVPSMKEYQDLSVADIVRKTNSSDEDTASKIDLKKD